VQRTRCPLKKSYFLCTRRPREDERADGISKEEADVFIDGVEERIHSQMLAVVAARMQQ